MLLGSNSKNIRSQGVVLISHLCMDFLFLDSTNYFVYGILKYYCLFEQSYLLSRLYMITLFNKEKLITLDQY